MQCDAGKIKHPLKSLARNMQSNGWPFKSHIFCTGLWTFNSGSRGLNKSIINKSKGVISSSIYLPFCLNVQSNMFTEFHHPLCIVIKKFLNQLCSEGNVQINFLFSPSVVLVMFNVYDHFVVAETQYEHKQFWIMAWTLAISRLPCIKLLCSWKKFVLIVNYFKVSLKLCEWTALHIQDVWAVFWYIFIHSLSILSDDRFKASSKMIPPHSAI